MRSIRRLAIAIALAAACHAGSAAHSGLRFSSPLDGATLGDSPTHVQLTFLERPEATLSTIRVVDGPGVAWQEGRAEPVADDPLSLVVRVRPMPKGVYTVHWRVVSAVDGHASAGVFVFGVLVTPTAAGATAAAEATASPMEIVARTLFLGGAIVLLGAAAARLGRFGGGREATLGAAGLMIAAAGLVLLAVAQQRAAGVGFGTLAATAIGRALIWRAVAIAAAGIGLALSVRPRRLVLGAVVTAAATLAAMTVHAAAGHAAAGRWPVAIAVAFQAVHLAAAGVWIGGLAALLASIRRAAPAQSDPSDSQLSAVAAQGSAMADKPTPDSIVHAVRRFSMLAGVALGAVLISGALRSVMELGRPADLIATTYGRLLLAKLTLLAGLAGLGAINRWRSVPRAVATLQPLRRIARAELVLAAVALAAAAWLGAVAPPAALRAIAGIDASGTDFATTVRARLTAASDQPGPNRFVVELADYDSREPVRADRVSLRFTPLDDPGVDASILVLTPGPGDDTYSYSASGANVGFDGRWRVDVLVERGGSSTDVPLEIETHSRPQQVSIERIPGQAPNYSVDLPRLGLVRFSPNPERPGRSEITVTCFDLIGDFRRMEQIVVTAADSDGVQRQLPIRRIDDYRFVADVELRPGRNRFVAVARSADGTRMRAAAEIDVPRQ